MLNTGPGEGIAVAAAVSAGTPGKLSGSSQRNKESVFVKQSISRDGNDKPE